MEGCWPGSATRNRCCRGPCYRLQVSVAVPFAIVRVGDRIAVDSAVCSGVLVVRVIQSQGSTTELQYLIGAEFITLRIKQRRGGLFSTVA